MESWHSCVHRADADRPGAERCGRRAEADCGCVRMAATGGGCGRMAAIGEGCGEGGREAGEPGPPTPPAAGPQAEPARPRS